MNFSLREIELRQKKINSLSKKKSYRRNEIMKYLRGLFIVLFIALVCVKLFYWMDHVIMEIPPVSERDLLSSGMKSSIYDSNGEVIQTIDASDVISRYVTIDKIPNVVQKAFVANEDRIFYQHHGVNARGVIEDFYARMIQRGEGLNTRYTITQQLIKNQLATQNYGNSVFQRLRNVIEEQYTAIALEDELSKDKILECYLNTINLGDDIVGVAAAAEKYFGKDISELNVSEAAVLAATAKNPSGFQPAAHSDENRQERMNVLKSMLDEQYISEEEYGDALGDDVYLRIRNNAAEEQESNKVHSYYTDAMLAQVISDLQTEKGYSATEANRMVYGRGLQIYSCMDSSIQKICDDVVNDKKYYPVSKKKKKEDLAVKKEIQTSFVLMEQKTGAVRAIVGGRGEKKENHGLNRAVNLERQPGTLFDVLSVYTPALDTSGMTLGDVQDDTAYEYPDTSTPVHDLDDETCQGLMTLRDSLVLSKAVPAVKVLDQISVEVGYSYLQRFGLTTLVEKKRATNGGERNGLADKNDFQLKMGLGQLADGVTNLEMTSAYAAFANRGVYQTPKFYTKVLDQNGKVLLKKKADKTHIMKRSTAWLLTNAMKNAPIQLEKELNGNRTEDGISVSGKSGRTEENTDIWYMGYTPYYTFGIWAGEDDSTPLESTVYVTTMWRDIMERVHKYKNVKKASFKKPNDIVSRKICTKCGGLAVSGLCDQAEGENIVRTEYYEKGTEPKKNCSCHVKYTFCKGSHKLATEHCPKEECYQKVFLLKKETGETADSRLLFSGYSDGSVCELHP